uniref:Trypsin-like proteinase T2a n=1 Tax=Galleria mellonella TaxID=7137 RepID=A0A3G1T1B8_GALME|nr:trypsin-like proteinase T2a precursor [Galleria mellonella]
MFSKLLVLLFFVFEYAKTQDANCDFRQDVEVGQTYYVYNPGYSSNYEPGVQCRWIGRCPDGYRCKLYCSEVSLPESPSCSLDRLLISKSGDPQLSAAEHYCGRGFMTVVSTGQTISVGLITSNNSPGGKFLCELTAERAGTSPNNRTCRCGYKKQTRIVGGEETAVNEYPMMVALVHSRTAEMECGGVIIDKRYVLTAAHCLDGQQISNLAVVVGEHNVDTGDSPATRGYIIMDVIIHPQYSSSSYTNDIAIVVLDQDIEFGPLVGPVCLPFKFADDDMAGDTVTVLGWGTLFIGGPVSKVLRQADLDVISQDQCQAKYQALDSSQICTYTPGKDACQLDSGGPLLYTDPATGLLFNVGVVSQGRLCASRGEPGVNTRVTEYLSWIINNTPEADYCRQ